MNQLISFATLAKPAKLSGVGLHNGEKVEVTLLPTDRCGIIFERTDLNGSTISADFRHINQTFHATVLQEGAASVSTTEHLLAALVGMGITHCHVLINNAEVPILDGSAKPWCELIAESGISKLPGQRPVLQLNEPFFVSQNDALVMAIPHDELKMTVNVDFGRDFLPKQLASFAGEIDFACDIAPARTFTLEEWIEPLREKGLIKGGSVDNAILISSESTSSALRFPNELARHKALDLLGDFALLTASRGAIIKAHLIAIKAGHALHAQWIKEATAQNMYFFS